MKTALFDYRLPKECIAQRPARPRDSSRLLVVDRKTLRIRHDTFAHFTRYLRPGDVLVFNDSKVFPARLIGRRPTGGKNEVFLLRPLRGRVWEVLIGGKVRRAGLEISFGEGLRCTPIGQRDSGAWHARFNKAAKDVFAIAEKIGSTPTPPYVKRRARMSDYQTVYAKKVGSAAAPTAGFHFTRRLLRELTRRGVQLEYVTLHVGLGTFQPVKELTIERHKIHAEYAEVDAQTVGRLASAKREGRRIIAVGTTSVRVLESVMAPRRKNAYRGWLDTFMYPGYRFRFVDAMVTNFHLPRSTLLMLVSAFAGRTLILDTYRKAIRKKYRFYSFGDGMFIQ
ncbi:MAG: tRNA preQ1(34) S-adenosylmethionine ribosyltransferase-isomerase QueA [Patescibacteria group bacterium]